MVGVELVKDRKTKVGGVSFGVWWLARALPLWWGVCFGGLGFACVAPQRKAPLRRRGLAERRRLRAAACARVRRGGWSRALGGQIAGHALVPDQPRRQPSLTTPSPKTPRPPKAPATAELNEAFEAMKDTGVLMGKGGLHGNVFRVKVDWGGKYSPVGAGRGAQARNMHPP
jgi:hypothetical protein